MKITDTIRIEMTGDEVRTALREYLVRHIVAIKATDATRPDSAFDVKGYIDAHGKIQCVLVVVYPR